MILESPAKKAAENAAKKAAEKAALGAPIKTPKTKKAALASKEKEARSMSFKNFVEKTQDSHTHEHLDDDILQIAKKVVAECQPFLKHSNRLPMYRGMRLYTKDQDNYLDFARVAQPTNRFPKDSGWFFTNCFNESFETIYGIPEVRRKSVFATGASYVADQYGATYFCFPIGDFGFAYSSDITDSYDEARKLYDQVGNAYGGHRDWFIANSPVKLQKEMFFEYSIFGWMAEGYLLHTIFTRLAEEGWKSLPETLNMDYATQMAVVAMKRIDPDNKSFDPNGMQSEHEFIDTMTKILVAWWPKMRELFLKRFTSMYVVDDNLRYGITAGVEIMIFNSVGYYLVKTSTVNKHYREMGGDPSARNSDLYKWFLEQGSK